MQREDLLSGDVGEVDGLSERFALVPCGRETDLHQLMTCLVRRLVVSTLQQSATRYDSQFLLWDAMLAQYMPWHCVCPSVRPSICPTITSQSSIEMAHGPSWFWREGFF